MRISEFWDLVDGEFGPARSRSLVKDHVLTVLGNQTAEQALLAGTDLREIWFAICDDLDVPSNRRWGRNENGRRR